MDAKKVAKETGIWIATALLILMFLNAGIRKLFEHGGWSVMFRRAGFPDWFRYAVGVWEIASAALLTYPRTAAYGAMGVVLMMLGAIGTNAVLGWWKGLPAPVICLVLGVLVFAVRWARRVTFTPARPLAPQR